MTIMQRPARTRVRYTERRWCEKDNKISFPMADPRLSRTGFPSLVFRRFSTMTGYALHVRAQSCTSSLSFRRDANGSTRGRLIVQDSVGPGTRPKTRTEESPCQRKRRPRQAPLLFARRTEYYYAHYCQQNGRKVRAAIEQGRAEAPACPAASVWEDREEASSSPVNIVLETRCSPRLEYSEDIVYRHFDLQGQE